jgi:hypothetical protein
VLQCLLNFNTQTKHALNMDEKQFIVFVLFVDTNVTSIAFKSPDLCVNLEQKDFSTS